MHMNKQIRPSVGATFMVAPTDGACFPFISLTSKNRATLPSPRATMKALPSQPNPTRPYGSSGLLPVFIV